MKNGAFAPKEQMLHFPQYFQICDISKALLWSKGLSACLFFLLSVGFFSSKFNFFTNSILAAYIDT